MLAKVVVSSLVWGALASLPTARADTLSPIFGSASVTPTSTAQNKFILGKGYYADTFGYYGISFANAAAAYGQYGDYNSAAAYANSAYQYFNAAAYYQATGQ